MTTNRSALGFSLALIFAASSAGCSGEGPDEGVGVTRLGASEDGLVYLGAVDVPTDDGGWLTAHEFGCDSRAFAAIADSEEEARQDLAHLIEAQPCELTAEETTTEYQAQSADGVIGPGSTHTLAVPPGAPPWWVQGAQKPPPFITGGKVIVAVESVAVPLGIALAIATGLTLVIDHQINGNWAWQMAGRENLPQALGFTQDLSTVPIPFASTVSCAFVNGPPPNGAPLLDYECQSAQGHIDSGYRWPFAWSVWTCADIWNGSGSSASWNNAVAFCNAQAAACVYATNAACGRPTNKANMSVDLRTADLTLVK
jgi:hypothetical protein